MRRIKLYLKLLWISLFSSMFTPTETITRQVDEITAELKRLKAEEGKTP